MTETSPLGLGRAAAARASTAKRRGTTAHAGPVARPASRAASSTTTASVLPRDGKAVGEIEVRGPWVTGAYHKDDDPEKFDDGWLRTGDVGTIDPRGYITLTDRAKDVIKSGGEWISSVELEDTLMAHPAVREAAVVGVPDERWEERPLAAVVLREGESVTRRGAADVARRPGGEVVVPERWAFIDEVPKTSVGKFDKKVLRKAYADGEITVETP